MPREVLVKREMARTMIAMQCILIIVKYKVHNVHYTVYSVQYTLYSVHYKRLSIMSKW